jgi:hypothetical protein
MLDKTSVYATQSRIWQALKGVLLYDIKKSSLSVRLGIVDTKLQESSR